MDLTPLIRPAMVRRFARTDRWEAEGPAPAQLRELRWMLRRAAGTEVGRKGGFAELATLPDERLHGEFARRMGLVEYEDIRADVLRMVRGESDVLWPGACRDFAQSSGTSGGRSKYIPVTGDSLRRNHYPGGADTVGAYLRLNPASRMFAGKGFILGGSFASTLKADDPRVRIGDLSATLISRIPLWAGLFRVPDRKTALEADWRVKLPELARKGARANVTNISGVPSWFLEVIREICRLEGKEKISDVWPNLEVFFHGGISFKPYREIYRNLTDPARMHFLETYNASEGFFAVQDDFASPGMLLLLDCGIFFEFLPLGAESPVAAWEVERGKVYELVITACNGLWRYRTGDTVRIEGTRPLKLTVAGRTRSFINAFGEELMEENAERAVAQACLQTGAEVLNYTAAPFYAGQRSRGHHQWAFEWRREPASIEAFANALDGELRRLNSDYDAKRAGTLFLDPPQVLTLPPGTFSRWLSESGNRKLGGQRKIPRLANDRKTMEEVLAIAARE